jgi:NAD(P)-dependent dehydrogenase (short-subunit alcohol dehydrogenase family)
MHALVASPFKSAYNAAKHGIAGFTKTVALEMAQKNITCNAICPGYVLTGAAAAGVLRLDAAAAAAGVLAWRLLACCDWRWMLLDAVGCFTPLPAVC